MPVLSAETQEFEIKLPLFEGPFDLLLFFIERDELDIYEIPISYITQEFLKYIHQLEQMNIEIAGEFIFVAATLMRIKAQRLLPRPKPQNGGNTEIDSEQDLIRHLLVYKQFKEISPALAELERLRAQIYTRASAEADLKIIGLASQAEYEWQSLNLYKLLHTFQKLMAKYNIEQARPSHTITQYAYSIEQQKEFVLKLLKDNSRLGFETIIQYSENKIAAIYNFLAILELLQNQAIGFWQGQGYNDFWILEQKTSGINIESEINNQ